MAAASAAKILITGLGRDPADHFGTVAGPRFERRSFRPGAIHFKRGDFGLGVPHDANLDLSPQHLECCRIAVPMTRESRLEPNALSTPLYAKNALDRCTVKPAG